MADRSLLARATEGTQAPTPGYLYLDIAKNAASSPMAAQEVARYLTNRLASKHNANIKYKCLKVIAKTAESPVTRGQFKRAVVQDPQAVGAIKEALQFRGPPDPARGDEPFQRVREAAKEALDAIYSDNPTSMSVPSADYGGGIGLSSGPGQPRRMEGIGNPMFKDPRLEQPTGPTTAGDILREAGETIVGMIKDPLARNVDIPPPRSSSMPGYGSGGYSNPPGRNQLAASTGGQWTMASNRGPNAVNPPANYDRDAAYYRQNQAFDWAANKSSGASSATSGGVGGSWASAGGGVAGAARVQPSTNPSQPYVGITPTTNMGSGGIAVSDGQYEKNLVMELCPPGGLKPEPPPDKLQKFAQSLYSLNPDLVCPALLDCLEEGQPWLIRAKALVVIETTINVGVGEDGVNKYADFFYECRGEIEPLAHHPRAAIQEPAKRVLALLGIESSGQTTAAQSSFPQPAAAPPATDLLDFSDPTPAPAPSAAPPAPLQTPTSSNNSGSSSLFGGLKVQDSSAPKAAAVSEHADGIRLLEAMKGKEDETSASAFGFMQQTTVTQHPAPAPATSGFDFLKEAVSAPVAATASTTPSNDSSGFDFMQQQAPSSVAATAHAPAPKGSFDPLSQGYVPSPNSQKSIAHGQQLTPIQLQAMYAQQNMLLMQQQMQQMQLAMAMQQQQQHQQHQQRVMQQGQPARQGSNPSVMATTGGGVAATSSFSFLDVGAQPTKKKEDKQFDFVKDAMSTEKKR